MGKAKVNIPMVAALILLMLTMIATHLTSGLYARYTATATGTDSARVAKFDIVCDVQSVKDAEGNTVAGQYTVIVENRSEVSVEYSINVAFAAPMSVTIGEETKSPATGEGSVTFNDDGWILAPGAEPAKHTMLLSPTDWTYITKDQTGESASKSVDFTVNITAEQID